MGTRSITRFAIVTPTASESARRSPSTMS
jgi:hypothetical protein